MLDIINNIIDSVNIKEGDTVFISSDSRRLIADGIRTGKRFEPNQLIDALIEKIGCSGTLLFPTYNWSYCQGITFDYKNTVCETGILGSIALKRDDFKRTKHPIYSFAVWGKDKEMLCNLSNVNSFGTDSPFAYLNSQNALNILVDVDYMNCFTFVHFVEEQSGVVKYRYQKMFSAPYIDNQGIVHESHYSMFVRDLDLDVQMVTNKIGAILEKEGVSQKIKIGNHLITSLRMGDAYPIIEDDIMNNRSRNICTYIGQED